MFMNRVIIYFIEGNLTLVLMSIILDVSSIDQNIGALKIISFITSLGLLLGMLVIYLKLFFQLYLVQDTTMSYYYVFYRPYFVDLKESEKFYHLLGMTKKILVVLFIIYSARKPEPQIFTIVVLLCIFILYTAYSRPHFSLFFTAAKLVADIMLVVIILLMREFGNQANKIYSKPTFSIKEQDEILKHGVILIILVCVYIGLYFILYVWGFIYEYIRFKNFDYQQYILSRAGQSVKLNAEANLNNTVNLSEPLDTRQEPTDRKGRN